MNTVILLHLGDIVFCVNNNDRKVFHVSFNIYVHRYGKCVRALFFRHFLDASGDGRPLSGDRPSLVGTDSQGGVGEDPSCKSTHPSSNPLLSSQRRQYF